ncbi:hypothetical protein Bca101_089857 [Brassica carinata]
MAAKSQSGSTTSKGMSWVTAAQEKKILRKYDLAITESEGQQTVEIPDEVINNANPLWKDYLIGKFLDTAPHIARIHAVVNKIWSYGDKKQVIDVQEVDGTTMKFRITNANVRARVLRRGMWNIGNIPLVVTKWTPDELKEKPEVKSIPLWVHLKNVPMHMFSWQGLSFITSAAGYPVRLHPETASCTNFKLAKVFINADLTKELPQQMTFTKNGKAFNVEFIYPWLPLRCLTCAKWGHAEKSCVRSKKESNELSVQDMAKELAKVATETSSKKQGESGGNEVDVFVVENDKLELQNIEQDDEIEEGQVVEEWYNVSNGKSSSKRQELKYGHVKLASRFEVLNDLEETEKVEEPEKQSVKDNMEESESLKQDEKSEVLNDLEETEKVEEPEKQSVKDNMEESESLKQDEKSETTKIPEETVILEGNVKQKEIGVSEKNERKDMAEEREGGELLEEDVTSDPAQVEVAGGQTVQGGKQKCETKGTKGDEEKSEKGESTYKRPYIPRNSKTNHKEMVKTKFTRNGREVMIFGAMRNFDYGSDEAIQESKKGGERDASVSLSSPERSRIRKSVEGSELIMRYSKKER